MANYFHQSMIGKVVSLNVRYEHVLAIANVLHDLHKELDKSKNRFIDYPEKEMQPLHQEIHDMCVNVAITMEKAVQDER